MLSHYIIRKDLSSLSFSQLHITLSPDYYSIKYILQEFYLQVTCSLLLDVGKINTFVTRRSFILLFETFFNSGSTAKPCKAMIKNYRLYFSHPLLPPNLLLTQIYVNFQTQTNIPCSQGRHYL